MLMFCSTPQTPLPEPTPALGAGPLLEHPAVHLLRGRSMAQWAQALLQGLQASGVDARAVAWRNGDGLAVVPQQVPAQVQQALAQALAAPPDMPQGGVWLLPTQEGRAEAALWVPETAPLPEPQQQALLSWLALAGQRADELLNQERHAQQLQRLAQAEKLQHALFDMADLAGSNLDMEGLLQGLHRTMGTLMYARNFYITLYDEQRQSLRFI